MLAKNTHEQNQLPMNWSVIFVKGYGDAIVDKSNINNGFLSVAPSGEVSVVFLGQCSKLEPQAPNSHLV